MILFHNSSQQKKSRRNAQERIHTAKPKQNHEPEATKTAGPRIRSLDVLDGSGQTQAEPRTRSHKNCRPRTPICFKSSRWQPPNPRRTTNQKPLQVPNSSREKPMISQHKRKHQVQNQHQQRQEHKDRNRHHHEDHQEHTLWRRRRRLNTLAFIAVDLFRDPQVAFGNGWKITGGLRSEVLGLFDGGRVLGDGRFFDSRASVDCRRGVDGCRASDGDRRLDGYRTIDGSWTIDDNRTIDGCRIIDDNRTLDDSRTIECPPPSATGRPVAEMLRGGRGSTKKLRARRTSGLERRYR